MAIAANGKTNKHESGHLAFGMLDLQFDVMDAMLLIHFSSQRDGYTGEITENYS